MKIIETLTVDGLVYNDENGINKRIDFKQCHENWVQYRRRTENLTDEMTDEVRKTDFCIGQRDFTASPPYIEFFTKPFTRIEFEISADEKDLQIELSRWKREIVSAGWTTIDLS
ncbi:hypothetical protein [Paenibacillus chitinolyticus]|uniref:hypothetical protein n=1 Tax=Paenibacillus chitinolyticus TaxID=79263 RepID=UPI003660980E